MIKRTKWFQAGGLLAMGLVVAAMTANGFAQGSESKGSASKDEKDKEKVEVKAVLNAQALKALQGARVPMVLLDTRGPSDQWIKGAVFVTHDADEQALHRAAPSKQQLVVTYCGGPACAASLMVANRLAELGYHNVIRFTDGVQGWKAAGYEMVAKDSSGSASRPQQGSAPKSGGGSGSR